MGSMQFVGTLCNFMRVKYYVNKLLFCVEPVTIRGEILVG